MTHSHDLSLTPISPDPFPLSLVDPYMTSTDLKAEIEGLASEYLNSVAVLSPTGRLDRLQRIQTAFARCREFGDDKVQLAMQTYEMV